MKIVIDTNILSKICYPEPQVNQIIATKFNEILRNGELKIYIPEICDYELRRSLMLNQLKSKEPGSEALKRLDKLIENLEFLSIDSEVMKVASFLWAEARAKGYSTAGDKALDADVILAAQAKKIGAIVITENKKHLARYVEAKLFSEIVS